MAASHYYLIASLPGLAFSAPAPMPVSALLEEAARHLDAASLDELRAVVDPSGAPAPVTLFGRAWQDGEIQLRNALARARGVRRGADDKKHQKAHRGFRVDIERVVTEAMSRAHPLEREQALDRFRWAMAEELAAGDAFGLPTLLGYAVRLRICERWQALSDEAGRERFEDTVGVVGVSSQELAGWAGLAQM
jgi:hypothetical protein